MTVVKEIYSLGLIELEKARHHAFCHDELGNYIPRMYDTTREITRSTEMTDSLQITIDRVKKEREKLKMPTLRNATLTFLEAGTTQLVSIYTKVEGKLIPAANPVHADRDAIFTKIIVYPYCNKYTAILRDCYDNIVFIAEFFNDNARTSAMTDTVNTKIQEAEQMVATTNPQLIALSLINALDRVSDLETLLKAYRDEANKLLGKAV